jgi:hypothetical protein
VKADPHVRRERRASPAFAVSRFRSIPLVSIRI